MKKTNKSHNYFFLYKQNNFEEVEKKTKVSFTNKALLVQSFLHRSYLHEHKNVGIDNNERLEYLGDAVLELITTKYLYRHYQKPEGVLTVWRSALVNTKSLFKVAEKLNFDPFVLLSKGERENNFRARKFILADTVEAFIGAVYLDGGLEVAEKFVERNILIYLPEIIEHQLFEDAKSKLQKKIQEKGGITPSYKVRAEHGPDHAKWFKVGVFFEDELIAEGEGLSKQEAEEEAAAKALKVN
ncbi:MAG: ribonuclease III [Candidatus Aerophobetes bacterium]|nr:ribonuclease III [Candidatus Aerophobetes bacterium]